MLQKTTIRFLKDLKRNNNKAWFDANRKAYEDAKTDFTNFIQVVIDQHSKKDVTIKNLLAKDCLFRINRDIRFSKDKTPYKTNFGASINKGGRKAWDTAGYYFHLEPGGCFAGGGIYMPMPDELRKVRQEIDYDFTRFKKIINAPKFKKVYGQLSSADEYKLSRLPKGYEPGNPAEEYLKLKSFIAMITIDDADLTSRNLVRKTVNAFDALQPLNNFINTATGS